MTFATFRITRMPFTVTLVIQKNKGNKEEMDELMHGIHKLFENNTPFTLLIDARVLSQVDMSSAMDIVRFMKINRANFKRMTKGSAILINSPIVRDLIKFVFSIQPPASPNVVTTEMMEALEFLKQFQ
jgi:hypothetical protein